MLKIVPYIRYLIFCYPVKPFVYFIITVFSCDFMSFK